MIDGPIHVPEIDAEVGKGELDYEVYLRTSELLSLQHSTEERCHPDELAFQVVHQVQELWLRLLNQRLVALVDLIDADAPSSVHRTINRCVVILESMCSSMDSLSTLMPADFQIIRRNLGDGSGLQSPGYAALRQAGAVVEEARQACFERAGVSLETVYRTHEPEYLVALCESLLDLDVAYQRWLVAHFYLVRRTIGVHRDVPALDGYPTKALEVRMKRPLFPELWDVRVALTRGWNREGGVAPGAPRSETLESPAPREARASDTLADAPRDGE